MPTVGFPESRTKLEGTKQLRSPIHKDQAAGQMRKLQGERRSEQIDQEILQTLYP
jgi:hypothetical protein